MASIPSIEKKQRAGLGVIKIQRFRRGYPWKLESDLAESRKTDLLLVPLVGHNEAHLGSPVVVKH